MFHLLSSTKLEIPEVKTLWRMAGWYFSFSNTLHTLQNHLIYCKSKVQYFKNAFNSYTDTNMSCRRSCFRKNYMRLVVKILWGSFSFDKLF